MTYDDFDHWDDDADREVAKEKIIDYDDIVTYTDLAILFKLPKGNEVWLPKSQITVFKGDKTVQVPGWLCLKNRL